MRLHSQGTRYAVYDDALDAAQINELRNSVDQRGLRPNISPINKFHDGLSFQASGPRGTIDQPANSTDGELVRSLATHCVRVLTSGDTDTHDRSWTYASTYTAYPTGAQLSWHDDGADRTGAFIYYLSDWSGEWGGELDVIDISTDKIPRTGTVAQSVVAAPVNATSIFPRANRLVIIGARTFHRVRRVDTLAGGNVRQAISGFVCPVTNSERKTNDTR